MKARAPTLVDRDLQLDIFELKQGVDQIPQNLFSSSGVIAGFSGTQKNSPVRRREDPSCKKSVPRLEIGAQINA